jgi:hypothetical protein
VGAEEEFHWAILRLPDGKARRRKATIVGGLTSRAEYARSGTVYISGMWVSTLKRKQALKPTQDRKDGQP